jgi:hypothetical protein
MTFKMRTDEKMSFLEDIFVNVAVLVISGASALALGHLFLKVVLKDRRSP